MQRVGAGWVLRLSNRMVQFMVEGSNYLIWGRRIWELTLSKEKEISVSKLRRGEGKGNGEHLGLLAKILGEI